MTPKWTKLQWYLTASDWTFSTTVCCKKREQVLWIREWLLPQIVLRLPRDFLFLQPTSGGRLISLLIKHPITYQPLTQNESTFVLVRSQTFPQCIQKTNVKNKKPRDLNAFLSITFYLYRVSINVWNNLFEVRGVPARQGMMNFVWTKVTDLAIIGISFNGTGWGLVSLR